MINSLPEDFVNRMKSQLDEEFDAFIESYNAKSVKSLRVNTLKISVDDCLSLLGLPASECEYVPWENRGIYCKEQSNEEQISETSFGKRAAHAAGAYYIQEASAMLPVTLLDVDQSGQKVLDLCAAPGGKSTQIAAYMNGCGLLVSNEIVPSRAKILSENIERLGVRNALVISEEPGKLADRFPAFFDRILVDAPCSGEGMFRKHPEAADEWSLENVLMCADRQDMILDCAAKMLAPGGKIVYSTCTFSTLEDEEAAKRFISRHPEFEICDEPFRLYPHKVRGEGHFAVSFARSTDTERPNIGGSVGAVRMTRAQRELLCDFAQGTLNKDSDFYRVLTDPKCDEADRLIRFGDSIYLAPDFLPDTAGLKVLRAGLKIGEFKKNRFEPDHAMALAMNKKDARICVDCDGKSPEVTDYLKGMTLINNYGCENGWCLVCTDGISLGWGKCTGGVIKNHYPKGLRIS